MTSIRFTLLNGNQVTAPAPPEGYRLHVSDIENGKIHPGIAIDNLSGLLYWNGTSWHTITHLPMLGITWYATKVS